MELIGRGTLLDELDRLLTRGDIRLVTLTGPPGIGKTRLALASAVRLRPAFGDGVCFVDLAAIEDPRLVLTSIANALGLPDAHAIQDAQRLLVLDNFEHVIDAAPDVVELLQRSPRMRVLVTSRAQLHIGDEIEVVVPPLAISEATALFIERAAAARETFALSASNAPAVSAICTQLEGIPLAIELAAARIQVLSAEQIAVRLTDAVNLLTSGRTPGPGRHQTLRVALDWSVRMLGETERALLRRLSVFAGGASLQAVRQVCDGSDGLGTLVDQSLVTMTDTRCRLLEPVRQYALEQLLAAGEEPAVRARHAQWCLELAELAAPETYGPDQRVWLDRLDAEYANLRSAVTWYLDRCDGDRALRLSAALWKFCEVRGHAAEGERWLSAALNVGTNDALLRGRALVGAANLAFVRGDFVRAAAWHAEDLELRRALGDTPGTAMSLFHLASLARSGGASERALDLCRESLELYRALGDQRMCANVLNSLGMTFTDRRAFVAARTALEEALAINRGLGGARRIAIVLGNLGDLARGEGSLERADAHLVQSLELFHELDDAWGSSATLESLGLVAADRGNAERAAVLFGAADAQRELAGAVLAPADVPAREHALARVRLGLGRIDFEAALARGRGMSRAEAVGLVAQPSPPRIGLSERERDVAALVARGASNVQIAGELVISKRTADTHVGNILKKLGLASRAQLAVWWVSRAS